MDGVGKTHFVDSNQSIYTWVDQIGKRHYADMPGHPTAVIVELVWHSAGTLAELGTGGSKKSESSDDEAYPGETPEERFEREEAEAYYCKRAQEIYESYENAPKLFKTSDDGSRIYLSDEEAKATLTETQARVDELCN
jgi:hypothetical protein